MGFVSDYLLGPIAVVFSVLGTTATLANLLVCVLLYRKPDKLLSCEFLITTNCILSAVFGLLLQFVGLYYFFNQSYLLSLITKYPLVKCAIFKVCPNFIMISCLGLILLIGVNRYSAVKLSFRYSTIFSRRRTSAAISCLLLLALLNAVPDLLLCQGYLQPLASSVQAFYIFGKGALVFSCVVMLGCVYKTISAYFMEPFWTPIYAAFAALLRPQLDHDGDSHRDRTHAGEGEAVTRVCHLDEAEPDCRAAAEQTPSMSTAARQPTTAHIPERSSLPTITVIPATPAQTRTFSDFRRRRKASSQSRHGMTASLFFGAVVFTLVTLPNCLYESICYFLPPSVLSDSLSMEIYFITSCFYGLLFVLNPFIFTCNDRYMKSCVRALKRKLLARCNLPVGRRRDPSDRDLHGGAPTANTVV